MTYRELIEDLKKLTEEQLDCTVTVEVMIKSRSARASVAALTREDHPVLTFSR